MLNICKMPCFHVSLFFGNYFYNFHESSTEIHLVHEIFWSFSLLHWIGRVKFYSITNLCEWWTLTLFDVQWRHLNYISSLLSSEVNVSVKKKFVSFFTTSRKLVNCSQTMFSYPRPVQEDPNFYAQKIITHLNHLFIPRKGEGMKTFISHPN